MSPGCGVNGSQGEAMEEGGQPQHPPPPDPVDPDAFALRWYHRTWVWLVIAVAGGVFGLLLVAFSQVLFEVNDAASDKSFWRG